MRPVAEHEEQCEEHNEKVCREEQRIPGKVYPLRKKEGADGFPAFQEGGFNLPAAVHDEKAYQFLAQPSHSEACPYASTPCWPARIMPYKAGTTAMISTPPSHDPGGNVFVMSH